MTDPLSLASRDRLMLNLPSKLEFGLCTFGDVNTTVAGTAVPQCQVIRDVITQAELADNLGLSFFGVGEHHRSDFAISAPEVVLSGIAGRTTNIRLGSAATVLGSDDPVRVFERFSSLDAVSSGRAEITVGRGSFLESFSLFGLSVDQYDELFREKLELLTLLTTRDEVSWSGFSRSTLTAQRVFPRTATPLSLWVGVGGNPNSVVRAACLGLPLMIGIIGGKPERYKAYVNLFYQTLAKYKRPAQPVGVHSLGFIAETEKEAREIFWPYYKVTRDKLTRERGFPAVDDARFEKEILEGSLYVGSPRTVAEKVAATCRVLGASRFQLKYSVGQLPHDYLMDSIRLYATEVVPAVRAILS